MTAGAASDVRPSLRLRELGTVVEFMTDAA